MRIRKIDTQNIRPLLEVGEGGMDLSGTGDDGRVYIGTGTENIALAKLSEIVPDVTTSLSANANILTYTDELGVDTNIDLSLYLDDTNLARLTSGTLNATTGIATFSRDDASTFTVDFSALFDDTNLARITSAGLSGTTITLTRDDASTVGIDLSAFDSRYEPKDTTILKDADLGVNVQAYDINIVSDSAYVHTDNNYTTAEKSKLGTIEAGATADQTKADIDALGVNAATVNSLTVETAVPTGAVFTDTTYSVGDGGLTENNFTTAYKNLVDSALQSETVTSISLTENTLTYVDENGTSTNIDLSAYLDEDVRAISSGTLNPTTGIVTYTRDDATTFTMDLSGLLDDTNLVTSVAGKSGVVTLTKSDVGLSSVDNTSDANKPVSTAQQTALNTKIDKVTSTDNAVVRFNGTTGVVQNSSVTISDTGILTATNVSGTNTGDQDVFTKTELNGSIGNIMSPLLDLPLKNSLAMKAGVGAVTFERATTATYIDRYGVLQTAGIDEPRFEKDGLLIEGSSTNLALNSGDVSLFDINAVVLSTDTTLTVDGTTLATKITGSGTTAEHHTSYNLAITGAKKRTASVFIKKADISNIELRFYNIGGSGSSYISSVFNFDTKVLSNSSDFKFLELHDGWFRISATYINTDQTSVIFRIYAGTGGVNTSTDSVYVDRVQIEELPFATSYIPTTDSVVTRGADVCSLDAIGNVGLLSNEVAVVATANLNGLSTSTDFTKRQTVLSIRTTTIVNAFSVVWQNNDDRLLNYYNNINTDYFTQRDLNQNKYLFQYLGNGTTQFFYNSLLVDTKTGLTPNTEIPTNIRIGSNNNLGYLNGHIKDLKIYDKALSPVEIKLLQGGV